jgi:hypothetical protein
VIECPKELKRSGRARADTEPSQHHITRCDPLLRVVIDGHHRLQATADFAQLRKARLKKSGKRGKYRMHIFVRIFEGMVQQARDLAVKRNCPSKLNMTKGDKSQAAWERVAGNDRHMVPEIVSITSISERMVKYMRKALAEAKKLYPEVDYATWPWTWVVRLLRGEDPTLDDQVSRDHKWVEDKTRHFGKTFGNDACRKTQLFGRVIRKHDAPMSVDLGKVLLALDREAKGDRDLEQRAEAAAERLQDQDTPVEAQ